MSKKIIVYTKNGCPYCLYAKRELRKRNLRFKEIDLTDNAKRQEFYRKWSHEGVSTMPQIFIDGKRIGGYDELMAYFKRHDESTELSFDEDF